eukprot:m51a1_g10666 hypothetical protein (271) ;mRNA; r:8297-9625
MEVLDLPDLVVETIVEMASRQSDPSQWWAYAAVCKRWRRVVLPVLARVRETLAVFTDASALYMAIERRGARLVRRPGHHGNYVWGFTQPLRAPGRPGAVARMSLVPSFSAGVYVGVAVTRGGAVPAELYDSPTSASGDFAAALCRGPAPFLLCVMGAYDGHVTTHVAAADGKLCMSVNKERPPLTERRNEKIVVEYRQGRVGFKFQRVEDGRRVDAVETAEVDVRDEGVRGCPDAMVRFVAGIYDDDVYVDCSTDTAFTPGSPLVPPNFY